MNLFQNELDHPKWVSEVKKGYNSDKFVDIIFRSFVAFEDPVWCFVVVVEGDFIYKMDEVMMRVDNINDKDSGDIGDYLGRIPEAVFVFLPEKYPENIFSNRNGLSPTMVWRV